MASCSKWEKRANGKKFCRIYVSRGVGVTPYTEIFEWPVKADGTPFSQRESERKLSNRCDELEHTDKSELLTKSERKARQAEQARIAEEQARVEAAKIKTFKQYAEQVFIPAKEITTAKKTVVYYKNALKNHLYPAFGDMPISSIATEQLSAFFLSKQKSGLSHSTCLGVYVTANQLFEMAYMENVIPVNPLDRVKRPRQRKDDVKTTDSMRYTEDEVEEIKKDLLNEPLKWQAFLQILLGTGMRRGECCALTWDKIDFVNNEITVDGNLIYVPNEEQKVSHEKPKTKAGVRVVPMTSEVADVLKRYRAEQVAAVTKRAARWERDHKEPIDIKRGAIPKYVFTERGNSDPMFPDAVNRYFQRFGKEYGIEDFHPHKLRHTAISIMLDNGAPPHIVAKIVGHSDTNVLYKTYAHADKDGMRAAIAFLDKKTKAS